MEFAMSQQKAIQTRLLAVGIVCLALSFLPYGGSHVDAETGENVTEWSIGLPFSPLWEYVSRDTPKGTKVEMGIRFLSWSWLPFLAGSLCLKVRHHYSQMLVNMSDDDSPGRAP